MVYTLKDFRCGVRSLGPREERVPSPVPRMDSPYTTGVRPPHRRQDASCSSTRSTYSSGKENASSKPMPKSSETRAGDRRRKQAQPTFLSLNIVQFNICGLSTKKDEIKNFFHENKIHIALLQETRHTEETDLYITGYTQYPCDCPNCQGAITYIRNDITGKVTNINTTQPTILQKAEIWHTGCKYEVYNLYNPPRNQMNLVPHFDDTHFSKTIIAGDFNGRSPSWGYNDQNPTGNFIETFCNTTNLFRMQDSDTPPTHFHRVHKTMNRPDLTLVSADLMAKTTAEVKDGIGSSDHLPIVIKIENPVKAKFKRWTRWNFKKAQWDKYKATSDKLLGEIDLEDQDIDRLNRKVTEAIMAAAEQCIPRGCRAKYKPFWNQKIACAVKEREAARKNYMKNDTIENKVLYNKTSAICKREILTGKRQKFETTCQKIDLAKEGAKAWSLLKNLNGENKRKNPQPLKEDGHTIADDQKRAESHNKFFANTNKANKLNEEDRQMLKLLKSKEKAPKANIKLFDDNFNTRELNKAIKKLRSRKSPGPDNIHNEMLTHLGSVGKKVVLFLINSSWCKGTLPKAWKLAIIKPLLKKGKPAEEL